MKFAVLSMSLQQQIRCLCSNIANFCKCGLQAGQPKVPCPLFVDWGIPKFQGLLSEWLADHSLTPADISPIFPWGVYQLAY